MSVPCYPLLLATMYVPCYTTMTRGTARRTPQCLSLATRAPHVSPSPCILTEEEELTMMMRMMQETDDDDEAYSEGGASMSATPTPRDLNHTPQTLNPEP